MSMEDGESKGIDIKEAGTLDQVYESVKQEMNSGDVEEVLSGIKDIVEDFRDKGSHMDKKRMIMIRSLLSPYGSFRGDDIGDKVIELLEKEDFSVNQGK